MPTTEENKNYDIVTVEENIPVSQGQEVVDLGNETTTTKNEYDFGRAKQVVGLKDDDTFTNLFNNPDINPKPKLDEEGIRQEKLKQKMGILLDSARLISDIAGVASGGNAYKRDDLITAKTDAKIQKLQDEYKKNLEDYNARMLGAATSDLTQKYKTLGDLLAQKTTTKTTNKKGLQNKGQQVVKATKQVVVKNNSSSNRSGGRGAIDENGNWNIRIDSNNGAKVVTIPKDKIAEVTQGIIQRARRNPDYWEYLTKELKVLGYDAENVMNEEGLKNITHNDAFLTNLASIVGGNLTEDVLKVITDESIPYNQYQWQPPIDKDGKFSNINKETARDGSPTINVRGASGPRKITTERKYRIFKKGVVDGRTEIVEQKDVEGKELLDMFEISEQEEVGEGKG